MVSSVALFSLRHLPCWFKQWAEQEFAGTFLLYQLSNSAGRCSTPNSSKPEAQQQPSKLGIQNGQTVPATKQLLFLTAAPGSKKAVSSQDGTFRVLCLFPMSRLQTKYTFHTNYCSAKYLYTDILPVLRSAQAPFQGCQANTSSSEEGSNSNDAT